MKRLARLGDHWTYRVDAQGQQTGHVLPYGERFKIGGDRLGRGFEVAAITGDEGLVAKPLTHPDVEGSDDLTLFIEIAVPL